MLTKPAVYDGLAQRLAMQGDTLAGGEVIPATNGTTNITLTGALLMQGILNLSNGGASVATIDTAANIVAALSAGLGTTGIQNGTTWRLRAIQTSAFTSTLTATANTGITVTRGVVSATSAKDFLITVTNGTPAATIAATTVNANAVLSGLTQAQASLLSPGMVVTNAQAGQQGNTILAVNVTAGTVTMSGNSNATNATAVSFNFSPTVLIEGLAP